MIASVEFSERFLRKLFSGMLLESFRFVAGQFDLTFVRKDVAADFPNEIVNRRNRTHRKSEKSDPETRKARQRWILCFYLLQLLVRG